MTPAVLVVASGARAEARVSCASPPKVSPPSLLFPARSHYRNGVILSREATSASLEQMGGLQEQSLETPDLGAAKKLVMIVRHL